MAYSSVFSRNPIFESLESISVTDCGPMPGTCSICTLVNEIICDNVVMADSLRLLRTRDDKSSSSIDILGSTGESSSGDFEAESASSVVGFNSLFANSTAMF